MESLCTTCQDMFNGRKKSIYRKRKHVNQDRFEHHASPWMLEISSQQGCYICTSIWKVFTPVEQDILRKTSRHTASIRGKQFVQSFRDFYPLKSLFRQSEFYSWHCKFDFPQLVFSFGHGSTWKEVKFDLLHPQGLCILKRNSVLD